jgi:methyl-accepting chemotaxis protein
LNTASAYVGIKKVEFLETATETLWFIIYSTLGVMVLAIVANYVAARGSVARPLKAAIATMKRLAAGDLTVDTPVHRRRDEIGEIMSYLGFGEE